MAQIIGEIRRFLIGEDRRIAGATVLLAIVLGIVVWILTTELNPGGHLHSAAPFSFPGIIFLVVLPVVGGYLLRVNRGLVPTFFLSFVPVYVFYGAVRSVPPVEGAINSAPAPVSQVGVWKLAVLYWLLGIGVAVLLEYRTDRSDDSRTPSILP